MKQSPLIFYAGQNIVTVFPDSLFYNRIPGILLQKAPDKPSFKKNIRSICRMIHCFRQKAVIPLQLFKSSDIMKKSDHLRKFPVLCRKSHPFCNLAASCHNTICMSNLQLYFAVCPVIIIQILLKFHPCLIIVHAAFSSSAPLQTVS